MAKRLLRHSFYAEKVVTQCLLIVEPATGKRNAGTCSARLCDGGSADVGRDDLVLGGASAADDLLKRLEQSRRHFST